MKSSTRHILVQMIAAILVFLFAYTAISKFFNFNVFRFTLGMAPVIGSFAGFMSIAIPAVNLVVALLLLVPRTRKAALWLSLFLLGAYTSYIGYVLLVSKQLPCSCNGIVPWLSWTNHFWLNLFIIALVISGLLLSKRLIAINPPVLANPGGRVS